MLFFGLFIYTRGWGEFGKLHEFSTSLVIAIFWLTVVGLDDTPSMARIRLAAAASALAAAIIVNIIVGIFLGGVFAALALAYVILGYRRPGFVCLVFAALSGVLVAGILLINFLTTGLIEAHELVYGWKFANVDKLHQWGALPVVLWMSRYYHSGGAPLLKSFYFLISVLRLDLLWPLVLGGLLAACLSGYERYRAGAFGRRSPSHAAFILIAAIIVSIVMTLTAVRVPLGSYYRFSTFIMPVMIIAGIAMWAAPVGNQSALVAMLRHRGAPIAVLALCAVMIASRARFNRDVGSLSANALGFASGTLSIDDAVVRQPMAGDQGPGGRQVPMPRWGGIYPGARGAYAIVGPHTPIWTMNRLTHCMLPDCKMMSFPHFIMTRSWDRVIWGTPEEGRKALRAAGLNYFLFSREFPINDPLPLSPLFSPDKIAQYFGIRWTDGTTTLLTWSGPDTTALDEAWLGDYRQSVLTSPGMLRFIPNLVIKPMFERLNATPHPSRLFKLP
jgi:hypothetical protein